MSTVKALLLCASLCVPAFAAGALAHRAITPVAPLDVHLSGDGAAQIGDALFTWPGPARAGDPSHAAMEVIAFRRWQNVETMTGLMATCGAACDGTAPVVLLRRPSLNGLTKVLFIDLGAHGAGPSLDRGDPMDDTTVACLAALIARHLHDRPQQIATCDMRPEVEATRPRPWTPRPPRPGLRRAL